MRVQKINHQQTFKGDAILKIYKKTGGTLPEIVESTEEFFTKNEQDAVTRGIIKHFYHPLAHGFQEIENNRPLLVRFFNELGINSEIIPETATLRALRGMDKESLTLSSSICPERIGGFSLTLNNLV